MDGDATMDVPAAQRASSGARARTTAGHAGHPVKIVARDVNVYYGEKHALKNVSVDIPERGVMAFIGPSGCGKSTFLRCINRMNDTIPGARVNGLITIDGKDIYDRNLDVVQLRARVGMVFQKPNPFPKSIFENVAYGPRIHGMTRNKAELDRALQVLPIKLNKIGRTAIYGSFFNFYLCEFQGRVNLPAGASIPVKYNTGSDRCDLG